jgi:arginase
VRVAVVTAPYHLGREGVGMGAGPDTLVAAGLGAALEEAGHEVELAPIARPGKTTNEVAASFAVLAAVAARVREAAAEGAFPLALAGNCMTSIGVVAGIGSDIGVLWLDAHPDFNTAEGTTSGFVDGMGLSILTGTGWDAMRETVPAYRAVPETHAVHVGARDFAPGERERLERSAVATVAPDELDRLDAALDRLRERGVSDLYLHLDLDVLDPSEGRANEYAADGGLTADDVARLIGSAGERFRLRAASVTAYDPAGDPERRVPPTAIRLARLLLDAARVGEEVAAR